MPRWHRLGADVCNYSFLNLALGCGRRSTPCPSRYCPWERAPVPILLMAGWELGPVYRVLFIFDATAPQWARTSSFTRFLDHTQRRTTFGRTPPDAWLARRRDLYWTIHNGHNRQTSMSPIWFEPIISAGERPQTYAIDRKTTGTDGLYGCKDKICWCNRFRSKNSPACSDAILTCHEPTEVF